VNYWPGTCTTYGVVAYGYVSVFASPMISVHAERSQSLATRLRS